MAFTAQLRIDWIVLVHHPRKDARLAATQREGVDAGILERLPAGFQHEALLRIHRKRVAWADPEELGIEVACVIKKSTFTHIGGAEMLGSG